ncbi:MAG: CtsR family transcriptional regulator [Clostridiales bacterium]|nr:CtsR family transcriptional regulator [Clostridiales bacterium]
MTVSDLIEQFLLETLGDDSTVNFNRNELAAYFAVAPSQINYVLSTRFTPERGFIIESRRGGGGSIKIIRLTESADDALVRYIDEILADGVEYVKACQIIDRLKGDGVYTDSEARLIKSALSDKALIAPTIAKNKLRGSILKSILIETLRISGENDDE